MVDRNNINFFQGNQAVNNSIIAQNQLAQFFFFEFWNDSTRFWKIL